MTRAAFKSLIDQIGVYQTISLLAWVVVDLIRGLPFKSLAKADSQKERDSREQLGPVILIYGRLCRIHDQADALEITRKVVIASGRAFLAQVLKRLSIDTLISLPITERTAYLKPLLDPIPNALYTLHFDEENRVHFTVKSCRFVELCATLGVPELTPLFCAVDDHFFRHDLPQVNLERATTLAHGGVSCPFVLSLKDSSSNMTHVNRTPEISAKNNAD